MTENPISTLKRLLRSRVINAAEELFNIKLDDVNVEVPPNTQLGDVAFPVAFELARHLKQQTGEKKNPRTIAEQIKDRLLDIEGVADVQVAGAGYLNVFFNRTAMLVELARAQNPAVDAVAPSAQPKRMVEHTSINPNKAAHIGHVRNAVLGDTFVRVLKAAGDRVEIQNYIDNTGVQVADVVVGFMHIEGLDLEQIIALDKSLPAESPFDYYCWDLYTRVGLFYRNGDQNAPVDPDKVKLQAATLHAIEEGNNEIARLADYVATRNVECILDTMERLDIRYDVLPRESEILHLRFWDRAFERMKDTGVIRFETEGRNKGCWVMPFESHTGTDEHEADKIIVRSNGTVTYTGKDIAYQLWKLGRLGLDFNYRLFRSHSDGDKTWITTSSPSAMNGGQHPSFGAGATVYNVIDARQSYTQDIVKQGVAAIAPDVGSEASVHLSYEMVALTAAACEELGIQLTDEDRSKPFIEMSGRKGIGVKADDLINRLELDALQEVAIRHPELSEEEKTKTAHAIAVGALRYFLLKFTRNTVIALDFKEALSFEGETGPYCQYSAVRANSIFRKLEQGAVEDALHVIEAARVAGEAISLSNFFDAEGSEEVWRLVTLASRLDEVVFLARASAEPAHVAKYAFGLARAFNLFYHHHKIVSETDRVRRSILIIAADVARRQLTNALAILGISVPERM